MPNKIFFILLLLFYLVQNSFAINMEKRYKIPQNTIDSFFRPIISEPNIVQLHATTNQKAKYLNYKDIFVKENLKNLGRYRWTDKRQMYLNITDGNTLLFEKGKNYIISNISNKNNSFFGNYINSIKKDNLSKENLKHIFKTFGGYNFKKIPINFYNSLIKNLNKKRLAHIKDNKYILIIDKNLQIGYIFLFHKKSISLEFIGEDKVSTGNYKFNTRNSRFVETPIGIINRAKYHRGDWHADKTNFSEYGEKGNRVFYLGKYILPIKYNSKFKRSVHLAIHSTNPIDNRLLGHKASRGCIRISNNLNKILSKSALIDGKNGKYVIIVSSKLSIKENLKRINKFYTYQKHTKLNKKYAMK